MFGTWTLIVCIALGSAGLCQPRVIDSYATEGECTAALSLWLAARDVKAAECQAPAEGREA